MLHGERERGPFTRARAGFILPDRINVTSRRHPGLAPLARPAAFRRAPRTAFGCALGRFGPAFRGPHAQTFRANDPAFRAALSFERMHQFLRVLRLLARKRDLEGDAGDWLGGEGSAPPGGRRLS